MSAIECEKVISRSDIKLLDLQALEVARVDAPGRKVASGKIIFDNDA